MSTKILVVDDDVDLATTIASSLEAAGYSPEAVHTAEDGYKKTLDFKPDLALLDIMVPNMGGLELCKLIRGQSDIPIIFLTALGDADSVVRGLELGADDYMVKPYQPQVLLARIKAHLRRAQGIKTAQLMNFSDGNLIIDMPARIVKVRGKEVDLTPREFSLLTTLAQNAGRVITTSELMEQAWDLKYPAADNIKPYIHYLRRKIELDPASPRWILTARGVGYRFVDE